MSPHITALVVGLRVTSLPVDSAVPFLEQKSFGFILVKYIISFFVLSCVPFGVLLKKSSNNKVT